VVDIRRHAASPACQIVENARSHRRSGDLANRFIGAKAASGKHPVLGGTNQKVLLLCANDLCFCAFETLLQGRVGAVEARGFRAARPMSA
jgi:hypothetical protein